MENGSGYSKHFKKGQPYQFALQGQFNNGKWGDPIPIGEYTDTGNINYYLTPNKSFLLDPVRTSKYTIPHTLTDLTNNNGVPSIYSNSDKQLTLEYPLSDNIAYKPSYSRADGSTSVWPFIYKDFNIDNANQYLAYYTKYKVNNTFKDCM